jgi:transcriptional regulator with PAS, ATPase and Fis domain
MSATNRDLQEMAKAGLFRHDLYYRLAVVPLGVRPLRSTPELVGELIDHFVSALNQRRDQPLTLSAPCRARLMNYSFPGNIRELQNIIQQISVTAGGVADTGHLPEAVLLEHAPRTGGNNDEGGLKARVRAFERRVINETIGKLGSKRKAAEALGVDIGTIVRKTQPKH